MCSENVAIGFKTNIEDYFMEKKQRYDAGAARGEQITFERSIFRKIGKL